MTNAVTFVVYGALGGALFLLPTVLQVVGRYSPLQSGIALLPLTVIMLLLSARSGRLASRIGPRLQMSVGPMIVGVGLVLLSHVGSDTSYLTGVLPAVLVVFGLGLSATVAPLTADGALVGARRTGWYRLCGEQRRSPDRRAARGGGAARADRHHREELPPSRPARTRLPDRVDRRGRGVSRRRCRCGGRHPQSHAAPDRGRTGRTPSTGSTRPLCTGRSTAGHPNQRLSPVGERTEPSVPARQRPKQP